MRTSRPASARPLVLFDIDGTLIRRAGPHHREALVEAVRREMKLESTTDGINTAGMLDQDILRLMLEQAGVGRKRIREHLPAVIRRAQSVYSTGAPSLRSKVCPGVKPLLAKLNRAGVVTGLVTGNLRQIGWRKMELAGLRRHFQFGAFAEEAATRAELAKVAIRHARREGWIGGRSRVSLIGDHPNDVMAARANGIQAVAVATGVVGADELSTHEPDVLVQDLRSLEWERLL